MLASESGDNCEQSSPTASMKKERGVWFPGCIRQHLETTRHFQDLSHYNKNQFTEHISLIDIMKSSKYTVLITIHMNTIHKESNHEIESSTMYKNNGLHVFNNYIHPITFSLSLQFHYLANQCNIARYILQIRKFSFCKAFERNLSCGLFFKVELPV